MNCRPFTHALTIATALALAISSSALASAHDSVPRETAGWSAHPLSGCGLPSTMHTPPDGYLTLSALKSAPVPMSSHSSVIQKAVQVHARWLTSTTCGARSDRVHTLPPRRGSQQPHALPPSNNWAGYQASTVDGESATAAEATWTVPKVSAIPPDDQTGYSSMWPGIGEGTNGDELIQAGTESNVPCDLLTCSHDEDMWYEMWPAELEYVDFGVAVAGGDQVGTEAEYSPDLNQATFILCNYTNKVCDSKTQTPPVPPDASVEWIVERPCVGNHFPVLEPFGTVTFTKALAYSNSYRKTVFQTGADSIDMGTGPNGTITMAATGPDTAGDGSSFSVTWKRWGPYSPYDGQGCKEKG